MVISVSPFVGFSIENVPCVAYDRTAVVLLVVESRPVSGLWFAGSDTCLDVSINLTALSLVASRPVMLYVIPSLVLVSVAVVVIYYKKKKNFAFKKKNFFVS
jgi:hypothetical protein